MRSQLPFPLRRSVVTVAALVALLFAGACSGNGEEQPAVKASPCPTPDVDALCTSTPSAAATTAPAVALASPTPMATPTAMATATMARAMATPSPAAMAPGGMASPSPVAGPTFRVGALTITEVNARAAPAGERSAAYLTIANGGSAEDALLAAASDVADTVEVHEVVMEGGLAKMQPVARIPVAAGGKETLRPGGYHVMFIGLRQELKEGSTIKVTLTFERAGAVPVEARVITYAMPAGGGMAGR